MLSHKLCSEVYDFYTAFFRNAEQLIVTFLALRIHLEVYTIFANTFTDDREPSNLFWYTS